MSQQHDVDGFGKHHTGCGTVTELLILLGADSLVEGRGAREIADWQVDEDHFGHSRSFRVARSEDERAGAIPTPAFEIFLGGEERHLSLAVPGTFAGPEPK